MVQKAAQNDEATMSHQWRAFLIINNAATVVRAGNPNIYGPAYCSTI